MAGIAFELKKKMAGRNLSSILQTFAYSAFLSSGPWIISVLSIIVASYIASRLVGNVTAVDRFQTSITYLMAVSLILSGPFQLYFSRFSSDRIWEKKTASILPNFFGALVFNMGIGFILYLPFAFLMFKSLPPLYTVLSLFSFAVLCGLWIGTSLLSGMQNYSFIIYSFIGGYLVTILIISFFGYLGLNLLMFAFLAGQSVIFVTMVAAIIYSYSSDKIISFDFLRKKNIYSSLLFIGFFYNAGLWADKFAFWLSPSTGSPVLAHLMASPVYDTPVFIAYLSMVPGMAVFFMKLEGEFSEYCGGYYRSLTEGKTLSEIYDAGNKLILSARSVFFDVMRIQAIADILILFMNKPIFRLAGIPFVYIPLFRVLLVGAMLQQLFMVVTGFLFYFDKRNKALFLCAVFFLLNLSLTLLSIKMGPYYYGYGYVASLLICVITGLFFIRGFLNEIHYYTYMYL